MVKFLITVLLFAGLSVQAKTYYVDASSGNDSNSGLSPSAAWKTAAKVNGFHFQPGDSVLFKRGETWKEQLNFSSSGAPGQPVVIRSYGNGALPVFSGKGNYDGWNNPFNWTLEKNNIWSRSQPYNPQRLWIDGKEVLRNEEIDSLDGRRYFWAWENSKIYVYSAGNPATSFHSMETNFLFTVVGFYNKNYVVLQDVEIQGGYAFALTIAGCGNLTVKNCRIGLYSRQGIQIRSERGVSSVKVTIDGCKLDSGFNFSYGKDKGIDDGIQIAGGANNCVVKNCEIRDFGHTGIYLKSLSANDNGVYDNKIFRNLITGEHVTYFRALGTDGYEGKCRNNEFYFNVIKNTNVHSQINGNDNWIHHNIFDGIKNSIVKTYPVGHAIELQGYGKNFACSGNKIDNNLIMNCDEPGISFNGNGNDKVNNYVRNNIILNCGRNSRAGLDNIGIEIENSSTIKTNYFLNNCVFSGDKTSPSVFVRGFYLTAEQFNALNSALDVASGNIQKNPQLETTDSVNFYLTKNSPCIDAGTDVGLKYDYYGNLIYAGAAPDIGIQEYYPSLGVEQNKNMGFELFQNYPNPFGKASRSGKSVTTIKYLIPPSAGTQKVGYVTLKVYDVLGRQIRALVDGRQTPGVHYARFNAAGLPSGVYFYKLTTKDFSLIKKMIFVK